MHIPIFDADNHLCETADALTKFLPDRYKGVVKYVEVDGRTKIMGGNLARLMNVPVEVDA